MNTMSMLALSGRRKAVRHCCRRSLYYVGNYAEAWKKVRLAEATPRRADLDSGFIAALPAKMPRP